MPAYPRFFGTTSAVTAIPAATSPRSQLRSYAGSHERIGRRPRTAAFYRCRDPGAVEVERGSQHRDPLDEVRRGIAGVVADLREPDEQLDRNAGPLGWRERAAPPSACDRPGHVPRPDQRPDGEQDEDGS